MPRMENRLWFLKRFEIFFVPLRQSQTPPPPKRAGGGALRPSNDTKVLSSSCQGLSERCWIAFQPVNHATPSGSRALRSPPQHPMGPGGRALITLRQVYLESAPEKEQRREDDRFFTGGTFLFLARGHSGRTTNTYKKKHSRLKEKKSVCSERLVHTLDRLQTRVTSACKQPSQSRIFDNMLLNVNYSSSHWEEKQICRRWIL